MAGVSMRERGGRFGHRREGHVETSPETGETWPPVKDAPRAEEAGRTLPWSLRRGRGPADALILDFWPLEL